MRLKPLLFAAGCVLLPLAPATCAATRKPARHHRSTVTQRKRLNVNDLITEPGTIELDWGNLYSYSTQSFTMPSAVKYTPSGSGLFWGRTEYSAAFDSLASDLDTEGRNSRFSDRVSFTATSVLYGSDHFDIAFAPQVTTFLRDESGVRAGATAIARYDGGGNSVGVTMGWSAATASSSTNPAGAWDFGAGFGRPLARSGLLAHFTPHLNVVLEKSTGLERTASTFGGVEYQITRQIAFDVSGQRIGLPGGGADRQFALGLTINLGKPH